MSTTVRDGRRRRLLRDGSASNANPTSKSESPAEKVRYTPREGSASFAVASGVAPRSPLALCGLAAGLLAVVGGLAWADTFGRAIGQSEAGIATARLLQIDQPGSLAAWWEACLWLAVAMQATLLFGVRRQRTDDTSNAHRWWLVVALVAVGMSLNSATGAHAVVATQLAKLSGFSPLAGHAFWWLLPATLGLGGITVRSLLEIRESRIAALIGVAGVAIATVGYTAAAGLVPSVLAQAFPAVVTSLVVPVSSMVAVSLALLTLLIYSRRIVREANGEVAAPKITPKPVPKAQVAQAPKPKLADTTRDEEPTGKQATRSHSKQTKVKLAEQADDDNFEEPEVVPTKKATRQAAKAAQAEPTQWVTGGDDFVDDYEEGSKSRKLSKAERKRLRREKERHAA